jgi:hypothetical protein
MVTDNSNFSELDLSKHNRYLIYKMLGRKISFLSPSRRQQRKEHTGVAQRVCRNIFEGHVELTVNGRLFRFKEPAVMVLDSDRSIVFIYGSRDDIDEGDDALFGALRNSMGDTIDDVIARSESTRTHVQRFMLGPMEKMAKTV